MTMYFKVKCDVFVQEAIWISKVSAHTFTWISLKCICKCQKAHVSYSMFSVVFSIDMWQVC